MRQLVLGLVPGLGLELGLELLLQQQQRQQARLRLPQSLLAMLQQQQAPCRLRLQPCFGCTFSTPVAPSLTPGDKQCLLANVSHHALAMRWSL